MKTLPTRILSATVAIVILYLANQFGGRQGVLAMGLFACAVGAVEYQKIAFARVNAPRLLKFWFLLISLLLLLLTVLNPLDLLTYWGILITTFVAGALWILRRNPNNETLLSILALAVLGFVYCSLLPTFALKILALPNGFIWFLLLIAVVFIGDAAAYFGGIALGRKKLMPNLSPSKTIAGAISGAIGSVIAGGFIAYFFLPQVPIWIVAVSSFFAAILAQNGDLFESLVKRVADVKDSGRIMPGHGGVLDRLDGVYFAAPLIYGISQWMSL